jgi:prepilin-type N-terminal cleavage/methylation domain-containing protein
VTSSEETVSVTGEAGFSLLEVMISLAILLTVLVSVSSLMVTAFKVGANSRFRQVATELATSTLDNQVQTGVTTLLTDVGDSALPIVTSAGQQYVMELEVSPYYPNNSSCASPSSSTGAMLKVTVWVTWADEPSGATWWVSGSSSSTGLLVEETTLLALPPTAFNSNEGSILVDITGATGTGIQGVTVTISSGGTSYTATTTGSGCALFANLSVTNWTVTGAKSGYIDDLDDWSTSTNSAATLSTTAGVVANTTDTVDWTYDQEATVSPTYTLAAAGSWLPTGVSSLPLTFYSNYSYPNYAWSSTASYVSAVPALVFPNTAAASPPPSYYVVAGSCGFESAPDGANYSPGATTDGQPVNLTPGSQATPSFALTPIDIVVQHGASFPSGASVTATSNDSNCGTGTLAMPTLGLGTSCVPGSSCAGNTAYRRTSHGRHGADATYVSACTSGCATSTTLSALSSATYGSPVTFTATLACTAGGGCAAPSTPNTGTVIFKSGGTTLGTGSVNSSGVATFTTSSLAVGSSTITAVYGGGGKWSGSTSSGKTQTITATTTTTTLTSSPNPNGYGTSATLTATVTADSPSTATPTGTVTFKNGATTLCSNVTLSSGTATCVWTTLSGDSGGTYSATAAYLSDNTTDYTSSTSSTMTQTISASSTTTTLTSSAFQNASTVGSSVTFTATVAATSGGPATGTITFTSDGAAIAACSTPVTLVSQSASCTTSALPAGSHSISAVYAATNSNNFAASTGVLTQNVYSSTGTASIISGLPYGVWVLTPSYLGANGTSVTVTVKPAGIFIGGTKVTGYISMSA